MRTIFILLCLLFTLTTGWTQEIPESFREISIQHQGRLKPLDTYARAYIMMFSEKSKLDGRDACEWLSDVWSNPNLAGDIPMFRIRNPEVLAALKCEADPKQLYSYNQIKPSLQKMEHSIHQLAGTERENRSPTENQLVDLHFKTINFDGLRYAWLPLSPQLKIDNQELSKTLGFSPNQIVSFGDVMLHAHQLIELNKKAQLNAGSDLALALKKLFSDVEQLAQKSRGESLAVIPGYLVGSDERWSSIWEVFSGQPLSQECIQFTTELKQWNEALQNNLFDQLDTTSQKIVQLQKSQAHTALEMIYNRGDFFFWSTLCYVLALILVAISLASPRLMKSMRLSSLAILWIGWILHSIGLTLRMIIMERPPVSNLYESILFVGWTAVICCLILEHIRRDRAGLLIATTSGAIIQYVGIRYAMDGDTMGMLVAVLNSKFWLTTHVLTITIGYGTTFIAGLVAHVYLFKAFRQPDKVTQLNDFEGLMTGMVLVSLFFTTLGTILGGIWADQSWGRFWGWDPKENGALLIVLWLLLIIHGRIAGILTSKVYACGLALSNVVVALAWFGVNLLNVGLHSYGFTDSIATNLALFCGIESLIAFILLFLSMRSEKKYLAQI